MTDSDPIHKRGKALEDEFFHRVDEKLAEKIRREIEREKPKAMLVAATGFQDSDLIDHLLDAGIGVEKLAAVALVPAVFVAWADGNVTAEERQTVLEAAGKDGLNKDSVAYHLVETWLDNRPASSLWDLWVEYAESLVDGMPASTKESLRNEIVRQATLVAKASGGTLGFGSVSTQEQIVLHKVENVLK